MRFYRFVTVTALATLLAACGTIPRRRRLSIPKPSRRACSAALRPVRRCANGSAPNGSGVTVQTDGERYDEWTYYYGEGRVSGGDARLKILQIKFDKGGAVRGYNWSGGQ